MPLSTDEAKALNEVFFEHLNKNLNVERAAADAAYNYTCSLMYHRFTKMPKRGFIRRILPPILLHTVEQLQAWGWPCNPSASHNGMATHLYDTGELYYEMLEEELDKADYQQRLKARQVQKWEWDLRQRTQRRIRRVLLEDVSGLPSRDECRKYFHRVMSRIASQIHARAI